MTNPASTVIGGLNTLIKVNPASNTALDSQKNLERGGKKKKSKEKGCEKERKLTTCLICTWGMGKQDEIKAMSNDSAFPSISFGEIRLLQFNRTQFAYCFGH